MRTFNLQWGVSALLLFSMAPSVAHAELANINFVMNATLVAYSCEVSPASKELFVAMGNWSTKQFFTASRSTAPVRFTINLENCSDLKQGITVMFNGTSDANNPALLSVAGGDSARGVAIAILDKSRVPLPLAQSVNMPDPTNGGRSAELVFYAQYIATGKNVSAGKADADATFTLSYD